MAAEGRLLFHIAEFERKLDVATKKSSEASSKVKRETRGMGESLSKGLKSAAVGGLGAVGIGVGINEVAQSVKRVTEEAERLRNLGQGMGEPVEALQRVKFAAEKLGVDFEGVAEISRELEDRLGDLGNDEPVEVLERMGMSAQDLIGMPIDQKLLTMAEAFQQARRDGVGYSDLLKLVGDEAGQNLLPVLAQSKEALEAVFSEAPTLAEDAVNRMAELNGEFDAMIEKSKAFIAKQVGDVVQWVELGQRMMEGQSRQDALAGMWDEQMMSQARNEQVAKDKAEGVAAARAAEKEAEARERSAEAAAKAQEQIAKIKADIEQGEFQLLPDDEKVQALKDKLDNLLDESISLFGLNYEESIAGLEQLAKDREANDTLPETGTNSAAEAWDWLREAKELARERSQLEQSIEEQKTKEAKKRAEELDKLSEQASEGRFELMDPEEQARQLTDQLSDSFGFDISGVEDVERGLAEARQRVEKARESGDQQAEKAALENLVETQNKAKDLASLTGAGGEGEAAPVNGRGTVAGAIANIFGRSAADLQLDEATKQTGLLSKIAGILSDIQGDDDTSPFPDPPLTYP